MTTETEQKPISIDTALKSFRDVFGPDIQLVLHNGETCVQRPGGQPFAVDCLPVEWPEGMTQYPGPKVTDEHAVRRGLVMCRDSFSEQWKGPFMLLHVCTTKDARPHCVLRSSNAIEYFNHARLCTTQEAAVWAGGTMGMCVPVKEEPEPPTPKTYAELQAEHGLQVGDYVKVTRRAGHRELSWPEMWTLSMDQAIGKHYQVLRLDDAGVILEVDSYEFYYPFFVLEKVPVEDIPVTDEDAKQRKLVMVRDAFSAVWDGPRMLCAVVNEKHGTFYRTLNRHGDETKYCSARHCTSEETTRWYPEFTLKQG